MDHAGRATACTRYYPDAQNDNTIVRLHATVTTIRQDKMYADAKYRVLGENGTLTGKDTTYKGAYLLVERGYHTVRGRACGH